MPDTDQDKTYYEHLLVSFRETTLTRDKSLLTLSTGGIGLLTTFLAAGGLKHVYELVFYLAAFLSFIASIILTLKVFKLNATLVIKLAESVLSKTEKPEIKTIEQTLDRLDKWTLRSFIIAIVFAIGIGLSIGIDKLNNRGDKAMSEEKDDSIGAMKESFGGLSRLKPIETPPDSGNLIERSFSGLSLMKPSAPATEGTASDKPAPASSGDSGIAGGSDSGKKE